MRFFYYDVGLHLVGIERRRNVVFSVGLPYLDLREGVSSRTYGAVF